MSYFWRVHHNVVLGLHQCPKHMAVKNLYFSAQLCMPMISRGPTKSHRARTSSLILKKKSVSHHGETLFFQEKHFRVWIFSFWINKHICMNIQFNLRAEFFYINTSSIERIVKINLVEHSVKRFLLLSHKSFLSFVCLLLFSSVTKTRMQYCV